MVLSSDRTRCRAVFFPDETSIPTRNRAPHPASEARHPACSRSFWRRGTDSAADARKRTYVRGMTADSPASPPAPIPYFDDLAELYERFTLVRDAATSPIRSWLLEQLPPGKRALDAGCGSGNNCVMLTEHYDDVVGVDIAQRMLDLAAAKSGRVPVRYECRSALDLSPATDGRFDLVMSVNAVFHMGAADVVLSRLRELVAPGGRLVIVDVTRPDDEEAGVPDTYAFDTARIVYEVSGDADAAADSLRMMLHPRWLEMSSALLPLTEEQFAREYRAALPGARIIPNLIPTLSAAVWDAA
ncbi:methyltransferase domain-containing protein [Nocardia seriolae]|nr:methyltransferase domain-containing protein [Nocardia seriolae]MTJ71364.1 methyltransferase domain-containing protein [Nocardia seriolae]MTJ86536.1 methyltransferase domain-containing protein [Nocardia seriolae]MTK30531.1 methyltransferase domain-containing protein [Nocardia seriolae]MTK39477.1 methyltransferase domain-containing protein [Nocardia seriolae]